MDKEQKIKIFKSELNYIKTERIKMAGELLISEIPDYFFEVAASSTGKYHPSFSLGEGGLLRHTKAAVKLAQELLSLEMFDKYPQETKDLMVLALILHDSRKHGESIEKNKFTISEHPVVASEAVKAKEEELLKMLKIEEIETLCGCIETHMGQWNTDYKTKREFTRKPQNGPENFVHISDYLASRKFLDIKFDEENNIVS